MDKIDFATKHSCSEAKKQDHKEYILLKIQSKLYRQKKYRHPTILFYLLY